MKFRYPSSVRERYTLQLRQWVLGEECLKSVCCLWQRFERDNLRVRTQRAERKGKLALISSSIDKRVWLTNSNNG